MYSPAPRSTLMALPEGPAGIRETLKLMKTLANYGKKQSVILQRAGELIKYVPPKAWFQEVKALWSFVKNDIRYTRDVKEVETLYYPEQTLAQAYGDCDDKSVLLASLLLATGHPVRFVAVGFKPDDYSHVFPETLIGKIWVPLETTENVDIGWSPPNVVSRMEIYA
jgi:hypothetical protein